MVPVGSGGNTSKGIAASRLVAHRGDAARYPENTLAAFQSVATLGLDQVELDVQVTADDIPVVLHDDDLVRTHGLSLSVSASSLGRLARAGVLTGGNKPPSIPILAEFSHWMRSHPTIHAFVEIKRDSLTAHGRHRVLKAVAQALVPIRDRITLIAYDARVLAMAYARGWEIGYVLARLDSRHRGVAERLEPRYLFAQWAPLLRLSPRWPGAWRWVAFEVADRAIARALATRGIDYLETMNPLALLGSQGKENS